MCPSASVGRIPIMTWWAPTLEPFSSASLSERRRLSSNFERPPSRSLAGATLISMLNWPSSVWKSGSAMASRTSAFFRAGSPASSMRLSSISRPVIGSSVSKRRLTQHAREHVEVAAHLLAVARPVGAAELLLIDLFAHDGTLVTRSPCRKPSAGLVSRRWVRRSLPTSGCSVAHVSGGVADSSSCATRLASEWVGLALAAPVDGAPRQGAVTGEPRREGQDGGGTGHVGGRKAAHRVGPELDGLPRIGRGRATPTPRRAAPPCVTRGGDGRQLGRGEGGAGARRGGGPAP